VAEAASFVSNGHSRFEAGSFGYGPECVMAKRAQSNVGWSPTTVTVALACAVLLLTWMVAASAYATARFQAEIAAAEASGEDPPDIHFIARPRVGRASGLVFGAMLLGEFIKNAFVELPNAPQVIVFAATQRLIIPIGFVLTEGIVIAIGVGLKLAERTMDGHAKKRRPRMPEIRVAKPSDD